MLEYKCNTLNPHHNFGVLMVSGTFILYLGTQVQFSLGAHLKLDLEIKNIPAQKAQVSVGHSTCGGMLEYKSITLNLRGHVRI